MDNSSVGKKGEDFCALQYEKEGYSIVSRNYHSRYGEIDVIAQKNDVIAFVEVKTRSENQLLEAKDSVTLSKQKKIVLTALSYLEKTGVKKTYRFDVFEVIHKDGKLLRYRKTKNAFEADSRVMKDYNF